ncbi:MAG: DUF4340 domain-containing protein [Gammaproteobacteria bacterium]|nr:DUF4340 domain-containing protein [Gammaproteobacteria bacterium]
MNNATLRLLGFVVAVLIAALLLIEAADDSDLPGAGSLLFPEMREAANDIDRITITRTGDTIVIEKRGDGWVVPERGNYSADVAKIRAVLLAMTDATVVEAKTANPDLHARLGVDSPDSEMSKGTAVAASAGETTYELIFGNVAQRSSRYARIAGDNQSWLIDQNPDIPGEPGEWLNTDIVDVDSNRIRAVTILHPDGEMISLGKETETAANFTVSDIPEGRELSYATVANGIGGALNDLDLDDVRTRVESADPVITTFETFDAVRIVVDISTDDEGNWIGIDIQLPADVEIDNANEWRTTRERVDGWQYRIADYKANLLKRRWADILKAEEADEEAGDE